MINMTQTFHYWVSIGRKRKRKKEMLIRKDTCMPMFIAALFTIAKICKCPSTDEHVKQWDVYMYIYN